MIGNDLEKCKNIKIMKKLSRIMVRKCCKMIMVDQKISKFLELSLMRENAKCFKMIG